MPESSPEAASNARVSVPFDRTNLPWDVWLNGQRWLLIPAVSWDEGVVSRWWMQSAAHRHAKARGLRVRTWSHVVSEWDPAAGVGLAVHAERTPQVVYSEEHPDWERRFGAVLGWDEDKQTGSPRQFRYFWDDWFDGEEHVLVRGRDFTCEPESMRALIYRKALSKGITVQVRYPNMGTLVVRKTSSVRATRYPRIATTGNVD